MTLQQQYNLIKEGKGNKDFFLKQARHLFPDYLTIHNTYEQTVGILRGKSIISEAVGGVVTLDNKKPDWFKIFDTNLKEAIGVKNTKEYGDQNEFEKIDSETQKTLDKTNFDYKDPKNIDNIYGQAFLNGYYTEMKDPKNSEKTVDELKQIVAKNLGKDINYYVKDGAFGVKGLGYSSEPTGGEPKPPKGKYKSSGYGDMPKAKVVKEGKDEDKIARYEKYTYTLDGKTVTPDDIAFYNNILGAELDGKVYKMGMPDENGNVELNTSKGKTGMYTESKHGDEADLKIYKSELNLINKTKASGEKQLKRKADLERKIADLEKKQTESLTEAKKLTVQKRIQELEKQNEIQALESKIASISEAIEELQSRLALTETDEVKELIDPRKFKEMQKEIKILEKYKAKCEKIYEKMSKGKKSAPSDEDMINEYFNSKPLKENENPYYDSDPSDGDSDFDMEQMVVANDLYEKGLQAYSEGDLLKAEKLYKGALKAGSWLSWTENELPPYETLKENENPPNKYTFVDKKVVRRISPNEDKSYDIQFDDRTEKTIYVSHDDWDKINSIYQKAKNG
jgi:hypothetical protein